MIKTFLYRIFCGFFLGLSIVAPGVSGSVMAVMMGIYDQLLSIVANPLKDFKKNVITLFPMGIGAGISLVLFILAFSYLFDTYEKATYLLFMGLIGGTLPVVFHNANRDGFKPKYLIAVFFTLTLAVFIGVLRSKLPEGQASMQTDPAILYLAVCGLISGIGSMVPGMSISLILILMGVYNYLMHAAKSLNLIVIAVVGSCFVVGMLGFSKLTKFVFDRYHSWAYFAVFGFMTGSLVDIWIGLPDHNVNFNWFLGCMMLVAGLFISLIFFILGRRFNRESPSLP